MAKDHLNINQTKGNMGFMTYSSEKITNNLPYVFFLIFLAMLYIGNAHYTEKKVRKIESLKNEIKELTWTYMSVKSDAIYQATYSKLADQVEKNQLSNDGSFPKKLSSRP
ncbi:MAG: hypothetical protein KDC53_19685 [Saprospiraceae bacterium]|nr:hypothetical protein [Saprospiraceae bacterium]